jgi:hypothetical protein
VCKVARSEDIIACWNAQGLKRKLGSAEFKDLIKDLDIIGIVETWVEEKDKIELMIWSCE